MKSPMLSVAKIYKNGSFRGEYSKLPTLAKKHSVVACSQAPVIVPYIQIV